jgi:hypothetical protein
MYKSGQPRRSFPPGCFLMFRLQRLVLCLQYWSTSAVAPFWNPQVVASMQSGWAVVKGTTAPRKWVRSNRPALTSVRLQGRKCPGMPRSGLQQKKETIAMVYKYKCAGIHVIGTHRIAGFLQRNLFALLQIHLYRCTECCTIFYEWK